MVETVLEMEEMELEMGAMELEMEVMELEWTLFQWSIFQWSIFLWWKERLVEKEPEYFQLMQFQKQVQTFLRKESKRDYRKVRSRICEVDPY